MYRKIFLVLCLLTALPLFGREFPLCLYGVNNPKDLRLIKQAGFNCLQTYSTEPALLADLAKEAKNQKIKVVFAPNKVLGTEYEKQAQKWPVLAWYIVDEPDVNRWSREQVTKKIQQTKQAFPTHDTALVIGQGKTAVPFYDLPDNMMVDWYPVPHLPLESFGDQVRFMKEGMAKMGVTAHPAWGVVQIFDWREFKQYRPDNDRIGRFPTAGEIRFMSYDGVVNGATGLFYFIFPHQGKPLPQSAPEFWKDVKQVVKELSKFKKIVEQGTETTNPVPVTKPLSMKSWHYKGHIYSVLVNAGLYAYPVPADLLNGSYKRLYGGKITPQISPYAVWVVKHK